jgi:hypothetical protein
MKRGRKALSTPTVEWKCRIPIDLAVKIDMLHLDPVKGTPEYGARSALITSLIREYLNKRERVASIDRLLLESDNVPMNSTTPHEGATP